MKLLILICLDDLKKFISNLLFPLLLQKTRSGKIDFKILEHFFNEIFSFINNFLILTFLIKL